MMSKNTHHLRPIQTILIVEEDRISEISPEKILSEVVGEKAFGLSSLHESWTLPFIVISAELLQSYEKDRNVDLLREKWEQNILIALGKKGITENDRVLIRSNSYVEDMSERGQYISRQGSVSNLFSSLIKFYDELMLLDGVAFSMPIIIQKYVIPLIKGHVSNERRLSRENRDWQCEYENGTDPFSISIRNWRDNTSIESSKNQSLMCPSDNGISSALKIPCKWATKEQLRLHFEWVYDGDNVFIVQADEEKPSSGIDPKSVVVNIDILPEFVPRTLTLLNISHEEKYSNFSKLKNALIYSKLDLPTSPLYVLDSIDEIKKLADGDVSSDLLYDLKHLTSRSLVIRSDIDSKDKAKCQMLPRSSEIRDIDAAVSWLQEKCKLLLTDYNEKFIFILHNFIPASASAFAYADPQNRIVLIESLWGLPEGLYYYAHDKYYVDTKTSKIENIDQDEIEITKDARFKRNFVYPDESGNWIVGKISDPSDWEISISDNNWIRNIAYQTRRIASNEQMGVSVMWFVDVDYSLYGCNVFPWHHEPYDYKEATVHSNKHKSAFEQEYVIHGLSDLQQLKDKIKANDAIKYKYILLQPTEAEMLRDKDSVAEIGELAKSIDAVIVIEGGILSHLYYQLTHTGAEVEAKRVFKKDPSSVEYNKLVRDKIPDKIEKNGEHAVVSKLSNNLKMQFLRRKLVEEAFEVLDAETDTDILSELADAAEVLDSIRKELKINKKELINAQKIKRDKAGGFEQGLYLYMTSKNRNETNGIIPPADNFKLDQRISKWSDTKKFTTQNEAITRFKIPLSLREWSVKASDTGLSSNSRSETIIKGKRENGILQIEVSIYEPTYEQISFFEKGK